MRILVFASLVGLMLGGCSAPADGPEFLVEGHATSFGDRDLSIHVGDGAVFEMVEASHTVDFSEGTDRVAGVSDAHSGNLDEGDTFEVTFTEPGTYPYFCRYHSSLSGGERVGMVGTITVT